MCVFFFQAEDGIRDLVRSRGLGDVYKRQGEHQVVSLEAEKELLLSQYTEARKLLLQLTESQAVSYTHLTLPTIYSV